MLVYGEIDGVFVDRLFDKERFESVHSFFENVVLLSHLDVKLGENRCPTLIDNSDTMCTYRTKTIEVSKEMGYSDPRIMEFDTIESILNA